MYLILINSTVYAGSLFPENHTLFKKNIYISVFKKKRKKINKISMNTYLCYQVVITVFGLYKSNICLEYGKIRKKGRWKESGEVLTLVFQNKLYIY